MKRQIKFGWQVVLYTWDESINEYRICKDRVYLSKKECENYAKDFILPNPEKDYVDYVKVRIDITDDYIKVSGNDF